jgi:hypothetical protein
MGRITVVDVISVVTCCASTLERLTLAIDAPNWAIREAQVPPNLQLSRLCHLHMVDRFSVLLPTMSAPKLMSLTIHPGGSGSKIADWSQASLPKTPTFPALLKLRVPRKMPENVLMTYLVAHPSLQTVRQVNAAIAERALLADNSESHTRLLPNLRCKLEIYRRRCCNTSIVSGAPTIFGVTAQMHTPFGEPWERSKARAR